MIAPDRVGTVRTPQIDYRGVPMAYWPKVSQRYDTKLSIPRDQISAVCRSMDDCNNLVQWFDNQPNFCPDLPVLLLIPGKHKLISGLGFSTAAELRDCCIEVWGVYTSSDGDKRWNVDEMRERSGYARREDVPAMVQEAFWEKAKQHKASPVTDPGRQPEYPNPTGKTQFTQPESQDWKAN